MEERNRVSVSVSPVMGKRLETVIGRSGLSVSEIIRSALNDYLKKEEGENGGE